MSGYFKPWSKPPELRPGELVRLVEEGPLYRVVRVTPTCATLKLRHAEPRPVSIPGRPTFYVYEQGAPIMVATTAFVIRVAPKEA